MDETVARELIARALGWNGAHVSLEDAVACVSVDQRGARVAEFPHSLWELLEHIRIAQRDLLDFCRNRDYEAPKWPEEYWPRDPEPPSAEAWEQSVRHVSTDRKELRDLALDTSIDLTSEIPHGDGQTYLRELLLAADHTAYHVGQMVALRKMLGIWG